jgi:hypothetical protein
MPFLYVFLAYLEHPYHIIKEIFSLSFALQISDTVCFFTPYSSQTPEMDIPNSNILINSNLCFTLKFVFFLLFCPCCVD